MALCLSIFLEAISRLFDPKPVSNPKLIFLVGSAGFLSNMLGLFLFHGHSHSHGHGRTDKVSRAEQGNSQTSLHPQTMASESARTMGTTSENYPGQGKDQSRSVGGGEDDSIAMNSESSSSARKITLTGSSRHHRHTSGSRSRSSNLEDINVHPVSLRSGFIATSAPRFEDIDSATGSDSEIENSAQKEAPTEGTPLLRKSTSDSSKKDIHPPAESNKLKTGDQYGHEGHSHTHPKEGNPGVHNRGDLNMRGIFLHVMGDALGNLGVIGSALLIGLTEYRWRFYSDPAISLIITVIILCSAIPLCKAASRILLQAVPTDTNVDEIKREINGLKGVQNCHHIHVWQLNETKFIASLHIRVNGDFKGEGFAKYMVLARDVSQCLHKYGIHSSTIQPEFLDNSRPQSLRSISDINDSGTNEANSRRGREKSKSGNRGEEESMDSEAKACLLECGDECDERGQCCAPGSISGDGYDEEGHSH